MCGLCPRNCDADREAGETGVCGAPATAVVSSVAPHFGEESVLVGRGGSGTIFLSGCPLRCPFCQNADISHSVSGVAVDVPDMADLMLRLERGGGSNVNFVTPTHVSEVLADAIREARRLGLGIPVVYNCGGYESVETLRTMEGLVEIYMPDFKFWDPERSARLLDAPDYPEVAREALREMHRQVGDLSIDASGLARQGVLVRHLVMPGGAEEGCRIMDFLADEVSPLTYVNVMDQYRPTFRASRFPEIDRRPTHAEWRRVFDHARERGLRLA
jgi:putative pyruvate formate lyase activating enzyme